MTTTKTTDFCNANGIKWFPINLTIDADENGKPKKIINEIQHKLYESFKCYNTDCKKYKGVCKCAVPAFRRTNKPNLHDFNDRLTERQELFTKCPQLFNRLCIDTSEFMHIDIDTEDYKPEFDTIAGMTPYFKSMTKLFGMHIIFKCPDFVPEADRMQFKNEVIKGEELGGVELLCGCGSFAPFEMQNTNYNIIELPLNDLHTQLIMNDKIPITKKTIIQQNGSMNAVNINADKMLEFGSIIKMEHLNLYQDWLKIV
jgi:hypothetical protein